MSRKPGHDAAAVQMLEQAEGWTFRLVRNHQDLELVKLPIKQAIRRGGSKDLLEPALQTIDQIAKHLHN